MCLYLIVTPHKFEFMMYQKNVLSQVMYIDFLLFVRNSGSVDFSY
jgi:hypothetical protein